MAMTGKKQKFAEAKAKGQSNKDAAISAGYSPGSAGAAGSRLAKDRDVIAYLDRKAKARAAKKPAAAAKATPSRPTHAAKSPETSLDQEAAAAAFDWGQATQFSDPKAFLKAVMNDVETEPKLRVFAAKELMPYHHRKLGDTGKKEDRQDAAKKAAAGRFASAAPPLRAVK
ncbi:terminase small subunit [Cupriavidus pauculus]|uniref:terminase small subunit n=1 Tax=Cupriavidus pauculus TaxID=82633 RepID=UPI000782CF59|nr:terminase small subunit [Cupriavidus pauculus]